MAERVAALIRTVEAGDRTATEAFWVAVTKSGTPLVDRIAGDERHRLVTFLWKGIPDTRTVSVMVGGNPNLARQAFQKVAGTDVWYRTEKMKSDVRCCYRIAVNETLSSLAGVPEADWVRCVRAMKTDPFNKRTEPNFVPFSILELPDAPPQPWTANRDVPLGVVVPGTRNSTVLNSNRTFSVYLPPGSGKEKPPDGLIVIFDGPTYRPFVTTILDNMTNDGVIPPTAAVFINNPNRTADLSCNSRFTDYLAKELVPWVRKEYGIAADPDRTGVAGSSLGGLAAVYTAFKHPDTFGAVLSQSGAFWYKPPEEAEPIWLAREFAAASKRPTRFYLDAGLMETTDVLGGDSILASNRHLRNVLRAKGNTVHYAEFNGGHEFLNWRGTFADGMIALFGKAPSKNGTKGSDK
jgi:enterochelin esterase family protein